MSPEVNPQAGLLVVTEAAACGAACAGEIGSQAGVGVGAVPSKPFNYSFNYSRWSNGGCFAVVSASPAPGMDFLKTS